MASYVLDEIRIPPLEWASDAEEIDIASSCCDVSVYSVNIASTAQIVRSPAAVDLASPEPSFNSIPSPDLPPHQSISASPPSAPSSHYSSSSGPEPAPSSHASSYDRADEPVTGLVRRNSLSETDTYTDSESPYPEVSNSVNAGQYSAILADFWAQQQQGVPPPPLLPPPPPPAAHLATRRRTEARPAPRPPRMVLFPPLQQQPSPVPPGFLHESRGRRSTFPRDGTGDDEGPGGGPVRGWVTGERGLQAARATIYRDREGNIVRVEEREAREGVKGRAKGMVKKAWGALKYYYVIREEERPERRSV